MTTIGIDLDAVLLDTHSAWRTYMDEHKDTHGHREATVWPYPTWDYPKDLCAKCFNRCLSSKLLPRTQFIQWAPAGVTNLAHGGYGLHLISSRREQHTDVIREMLAEHGILDCFASVNLGHSNKVDLCDALGVDIMLDDSPHVLESLNADSLITLAVAFAYPYNVGWHPRVKSWPEFIGLVKDLEMAA